LNYISLFYSLFSLYPFTNFTTNYPVGIPKVHIVNKRINWTQPDDLLFPLSIIKAFVIPPKQCKVPVLPMKLDKDDRLLFPLCSKCCKEYPKGAVNEEYSCQHSDEERGWVSMCTSIEAAEALAAGYCFTELYRVLEYERSDDQLFRSYVREFLTEKFHASGFDSTIKGNYEEEEKFIAECLEMFGIKIDREKMKTNNRRRALAKLCLNNLWGRFSLRNYGLSETQITDDPAELRRYLEDRSLDVTALDELDEETIMISFVRKRDRVEEGDASNVVISLWTTSQARILLLKAMQKVANTPGCEILYTGKPFD